jgi:methionine--tRNA ligase beta chain
MISIGKLFYQLDVRVARIL